MVVMSNDKVIDLEQMRQSAESVSELLKIVAHPERLMVLCQLTKGEIGVGELQQSSTLSQSAFSQHLTVLRKHGLVNARKASQQVFYSLADPRIEKLIGSLQFIFCS
ncbi:helix-turn-helix transcriptional regulator [Vibrio vulnificus]|nr:helix-turn-helix transcriptional regulator [Vibrio vulnificus]